MYYVYLNHIKSIWDGSVRNSDRFFTIAQSVSAGLFAATATLLTNPLDMFRVRVQVHRVGYLKTAEEMWKIEGRRCLYKGLTPRLLSKSISSALWMVMYESVKKLSVKDEYAHLVVR